jgi:hypothetical protein
MASTERKVSFLTNISSSAWLAFRAPGGFLALKRSIKLYYRMQDADKSAQRMHDLVDKFTSCKGFNSFELHKLLSKQYRYSIDSSCQAAYKQQQDIGRRKILDFYDQVINSAEQAEEICRRDAILDLVLFSLRGCIGNSAVRHSLREGCHSPYAPAWLKERVQNY